MPRRKNLVIVRAGDLSLHEQWLDGDEERNWDMIVNYFGDDPDRYRRDDVQRIDSKSIKWPALHDLILQLGPDVSWYDRVWFPDDDLKMTKAQINSFFEIVEKHNFALAQPALTRDSYISHLVTLHNPLFLLRFTNFVEIMAPCFSRDFLLRVLPSFKENLSGWGLDFLWPSCVSDWTKIAIVDAVAVCHTRPIGGPNYPFLAGTGKNATQEMWELLAKYGLSLEHPFVRGGIDELGRMLSMFDATAVTLTEKLISGYRSQISRDVSQLLMQLVRPNIERLGITIRTENDNGNDNNGNNKATNAEVAPDSVAARPGAARRELKVAFCFLTLADLHQQDIWRRYFSSALPEQYSIYCHPKQPEQVAGSLLKGGIIDETVPTHHGGVSLVQASLNLFLQAYKDVENEYFVLSSESTIPITSFDQLLAGLERCRSRSIFSYRVAPPESEHYGRLAAIKQPELFSAAFFHHHQWIILHRRHVAMLLDRPGLALFSDMFAPDEHYFMNALVHLKGARLDEFVNQRATFVNWQEKEFRERRDPATEELVARTVHPKTYHQLSVADLAQADGCWFFRKVSAACDCTLVSERLGLIAAAA